MRGYKVMLDTNLTALYGVETRNLNKAVKRNRGRFPSDFMFQLTLEETRNLRFQFGTSKGSRGARSYLPYAFAGQGVSMLSSVVNSPRVILVNIAIMRAFVKLRRLLATHADLARKLDTMEKGFDQQPKIVFHAIRQLRQPPSSRQKRQIGFCHPPTLIPPDKKIIHFCCRGSEPARAGLFLRRACCERIAGLPVLTAQGSRR